MERETHKTKLYKKYAITRLGELIEGRIDKPYFEKDLKRYRKAYGIKTKKYWEWLNRG